MRVKVSDLLQSRQKNWLALEQHCRALEGGSRRRLDPHLVTEFTSLYRAACADLALADAYQLPHGTVTYLHQLVGRAHNQLYRSRIFNFRRWGHELFVTVPQRLYNDNALRLAFVIFWGVFIASGVMVYVNPALAEDILPHEMILTLDESFSQPVDERLALEGSSMVGFYIYNNTSIGLRCFAFGLLFGLGGLFVMVFNATMLGAAFGHMARSPHAENFFQFVTAHGPMELTAIILSAAAGMRLGFALVDTRGYTRGASLRRMLAGVMPTMGAAMVMFAIAALIEGFLSPSPAPYWVKATVGAATSGLLVFYFVGLGQPRRA